MNPDRFAAIAGRYPGLRIAVVGDFFLDRYLLIDPEKVDVSIETGLPVHNVVAVRSQPGAAGTAGASGRGREDHAARVRLYVRWQT